jgi:3-hydroxybutyryl-CoA dehydrogenase
LQNNIIKNISVIGAGTMGNGICHVFAQAGFRVTLCDLNESSLQKAEEQIKMNLARMANKGNIQEVVIESTLNNITFTTSLKEACHEANLVVEAIFENENAKKQLLKEIDALVNDTCILASNTSSISITELASCTNRGDKFIGMHFMNPVPIMKLVEVIRGYNTGNETCAIITEVIRKLGKEPIEVNDYPGFIANRILMPMINEAIQALHEGVAGVEAIDGIMKLGMAHPMGPLSLADFIGLDVCLSILNVMYKGFGNPKYAPSPLLVNMVAAGKLGRKSKEGFYNYQNKDNITVAFRK